MAIAAGFVALTIDLSGRLYTLAGGWLAVAAGVVALTVAAVAVGAPAAASDRMTAVAVAVRWVLIMSTLLWFLDRRVRSVRRVRCGGLVEKRSRPV